ncbi:hypothetical protein GMOD_00004531 [Pyrenophora seminiperda CCB06]|uniref:Uncharacterized protein n=1 Tax=Pyrenophora seminiperda CCB06 TaxID=1302712 RepID=A0A3M7MGX3_9PLEO|nr:hypothetical protein GMOD_00004531 [Pyrenophora seminiperda CCB06]
MLLSTCPKLQFSLQICLFRSFLPFAKYTSTSEKNPRLSPRRPKGYKMSYLNIMNAFVYVCVCVPMREKP